jgi:hypothetical protein
MERREDHIYFEEVEQLAGDLPIFIRADVAPSVFNNVLADIQSAERIKRDLPDFGLGIMPETNRLLWLASQEIRLKILKTMQADLGKLAAHEIKNDTTFRHGDKLDEE